MTLGLPCDANGSFSPAAYDALRIVADRATVIAIGPGLGRAAAMPDFVARVYTQLNQPMVVDADALYALAQQPEALADPAGPRVLTPHPGEFRLLLAAQHVADTGNRELLEHRAVELAAKWKAVVVLKGHSTLVTDGTQSKHNTTGNPGMATGGTGDVLTGIIAALLAQKMTPFDAARLGAHVHGEAGDCALYKYGEVSMIASDLIRFLPDAFRVPNDIPF
jgi:NAD(P)H-hydrate epimerase